MAFDVQSFVQKRIPTAGATGGFDVNTFLKKRGITPKADLSTVQGLQTTADAAGLGDKAAQITDTTPRLSFLQRLGAGLGAFNPAQAVETGIEKGAGAGILEYPKSIVKGLISAATGKDYQPDRKSSSDVVEKLGVENTILKHGLGFIGDVLLDPTTYFGGTMVKGLLKGTGAIGETALKVVGKAAPEVEQGLRLAGKGAKDALGKAFVYGYGTSKGLAERTLEIGTKVDNAKAGIVVSNLDRLGTGVLSKSQQEELVMKMLAGKRAEFGIGKGTEAGVRAAQEAAQSADPLVQKTIGEQAARSQKFAAQAGIKDPYEIYFPGLATDKVKKFMEGTRQLRVGSEGYLKEFKNLLTDEQLIKNPAEAFARREFDIAKDSIIRTQLRGIVSDFGKPLNAFKSEEEALKEGYRLVREKGIFGKPVGYLSQADNKFINNLITPEFTTIDAVAKATGFDAITSLFKRSVTGLFAPFHVRNYVSGMVQNFEVLGTDALKPQNIAAGQKLAWKIARGEKFGNTVANIGGKEINLGKVMQRFADRFGSSSSYIADIADATKGAGNIPGKILSKGSVMETAKTLGLGQQAIPFRVARGIGNFIETQQKATAYITALGQGKTVDEALTLAARAGFDYRALTPFESKVMRRIIPFYSFTRKNIELQLRTLGENPQRVNQIFAALNNLGDKPTADERQALPDYIKNAFGVKLSDTPEGLKQYISSFGTPVEAFANLFDKNPVLRTLSQTNPLLKVPVEIGIGKDSFRQRDLKDVYDAREYKGAPQIVKDLLDIQEVQKPIYQKNAVGKFVKTGERTQYVADPVKLLIARSLFTSRGFTYLDQAFGGDIQGLAKALKLTTGIKPQQIDLEQQKSFQELDQKRALEDLLIKHGVLRQFTNTYVPKK